MNTTQIIREYSSGRVTLEAANKALEAVGSPVRLDPEKNKLTAQELACTFVGDTPDTVCGWGLMDSGTGTLDKVKIKDGQLVDCDMGEAFAMVFVGGDAYEVKGKTLT